ncbi:MAG: Ig-like domain-containing protein [Fibrobacteres bacterium]|nr:Ig-like domain-containing protein [Fibrobacterota bacterium]
MVVLKRVYTAFFGLVVLWGCNERDFSSPWPSTPSDSGSVVAAKPVSPPKEKKDTVSIHVGTTILIESLSATDLRLSVGETKSAPVSVLPSNASSPLYEMTSSKPGVAEVTANGIHGSGAGSATITVHALDGSGKTTHFHVIVDAILDGCLLLPCLCLGKLAGDGKGKDKGNGDGGDAANSCPD